MALEVIIYFSIPSSQNSALSGSTLRVITLVIITKVKPSRDCRKPRNVIAFLVFFTMLFNGGLVPTYIMYSQVFHIRDSIFALLIPTFLMSPFNVIQGYDAQQGQNGQHHVRDNLGGFT